MFPFFCWFSDSPVLDLSWSGAKESLASSTGNPKRRPYCGSPKLRKGTSSKRLRRLKTSLKFIKYINNYKYVLPCINKTIAWKKDGIALAFGEALDLFQATGLCNTLWVFGYWRCNRVVSRSFCKFQLEMHSVGWAFWLRWIIAMPMHRPGELGKETSWYHKLHLKARVNETDFVVVMFLLFLFKSFWAFLSFSIFAGPFYLPHTVTGHFMLLGNLAWEPLWRPECVGPSHSFALSAMLRHGSVWSTLCQLNIKTASPGTRSHAQPWRPKEPNAFWLADVLCESYIRLWDAVSTTEQFDDLGPRFRFPVAIQFLVACWRLMRYTFADVLSTRPAHSKMLIDPWNGTWSHTEGLIVHDLPVDEKRRTVHMEQPSF